MTLSNPACGISEFGHFLSFFGMISSFFGKSDKGPDKSMPNNSNS